MAWSTSHSFATGSALSHTSPKLFVEGGTFRAFVNWQRDPHANYVARFVFPKPARNLKIEVDLVADMASTRSIFLEEYADKFPFEYEPQLARDLRPFLEQLPAEPLFSNCFLLWIALSKALQNFW